MYVEGGGAMVSLVFPHAIFGSKALIIWYYFFFAHPLIP